jgi:hypothetical protein
MRGVIAGLAVLLVLGLFFFRTTSQSPAPTEMTDAEVAAIEEAVRAQANALIETQNALDADGFLEVFSRGDLHWVNDDVEYESLDDVAGVVRGLLADLDGFDSGWNDLGVTVLSRTAALCQGEWWGDHVRGDQVTHFEPVFWTALHELQPDGSWKITRVHQSWADPGAEG